MQDAPPDRWRNVTVERVIHRGHDSGFTVIEVSPEAGGEAFVAVGVLPLEVRVGEPLLLEGAWQDHPRFGRRFRIQAARPHVPSTPDGIRRYLASGRVHGIGPKLAERLVEHFGAQTLQILEGDTDRAREVPGVGKSKVAELRQAFQSDRAQRETLVFLQGLGLGPGTALQLWESLGSNAVARVKADPYALCELVSGVGFRTADRLAAGMDITGDHPARVRGGLRHMLQVALDQGHMALEEPELVTRTSELLDVAEQVVSAGLAGEIAERRLRGVRPEVPEFAEQPPVLVYLPALLQTELEITRRLVELAGTPRSEPPRGPLRLAAGVQLTEDQAAAVRLLLQEKLVLLTGGPGVGKTFVLRHVVQACRAGGLEVSLASPTGRAARRMTQATGFEARTLHRLCGLVPGVERADRGDLLETDVLVIDEVSMLDLPLFLRVLRQLRPDTVLILVGDPDQLPSVGPGRLLADLLESRRFPAAALREIFRQETRSMIVANAHRILRGEPVVCQEDGGPSDFFFMQRDTAADGARLIIDLVCRRLPEHYGLDPRGEIQVLSPMHRGPAGVTALNERLQEELARGRPAIEVHGRRLRQGDRVLFTVNDYDLGLMNGDLGSVLEVDAERSQLLCDFEGRHQWLSGRGLDALQVAYAMTVHKSQGGEFPAVVMPVFSDHRLLLRRNVLYTAVTRARRLMVLVGSESAVRIAISDDRLARRQGGLLHLLMGRRLVDVPPDTPLDTR